MIITHATYPLGEMRMGHIVAFVFDDSECSLPKPFEYKIVLNERVCRDRSIRIAVAAAAAGGAKFIRAAAEDLASSFGVDPFAAKTLDEATMHCLACVRAFMCGVEVGSSFLAKSVCEARASAN